MKDDSYNIWIHFLTIPKPVIYQNSMNVGSPVLCVWPNKIIKKSDKCLEIESGAIGDAGRITEFEEYAFFPNKMGVEQELPYEYNTSWKLNTYLWSLVKEISKAKTELLFDSFIDNLINNGAYEKIVKGATIFKKCSIK